MMRSRFTVGVLASLITSVTSLAADLDDSYGAAYEPLRAELLPDTHALPRVPAVATPGPDPVELIWVTLKR